MCQLHELGIQVFQCQVNKNTQVLVLAWFDGQRIRLLLHGIAYLQIRLGSDPLWYRSTLFTRDRFETGTVRFYMGSTS